MAVLAVVLAGTMSAFSVPFLSGRNELAVGLALLALFAATEVFSVHLHFARNTHSFSLFEVPLVLGLFLAPARTLLLAHVVGCGMALALHRRQPVLKLAFNLAAVVVVDVVALRAFRWGAGPPGSFGSRPVAAALVGTLIASSVSALLVLAVITLAEGRTPDGLWSSMPFGMLAAAVSTSLGLIAVGLIGAYAEVSWLLLVPTAALYLVNRAYVGERRRHEGIGFLHDSTTLLLQSPELATSLVQLVEHARTVFKAGFAELAYLPRNDTELVDVIVDDGGAQTRHEPLAGSPHARLMEGAARTNGAMRLDRRACSIEEASFLDERSLTDAVAAVLRSEDRVCGVLVMGNRLGDVAQFDRDDAVVLETFAASISVALDNSRLEQSLDELRELQLRLTHQATHDALTELANRTLFTNEVTEALGRLDAAGLGVAVMFIDLDDFKTVNDSLGHAAGDELLIVISRRLANVVAGRGVAARLGGDEFAIVVPRVTGDGDAMALAEELLGALTAPVAIDGRTVPTGASIGVAVSTRGQAAAELLRNADTAMYAAKERGKHCVALYHPELHEAAVHRYNLTFELGRALTEGEFVVHYQPIIELGPARMVGAEALVRWNHPTLGLLTPGAFIPIAEESDAIVKIGRAVLERVCAHLAHGELDQLGYISVNLCARDLVDPSLAPELMAIIEGHGVEPRRLVFEVTESSMITDPVTAIRTLNTLRDLGARVALDDFGTGYSSMSYLSRLPLNILKIAQPFVDDLVPPVTDTRLVDAIIHLGRALGYNIVAEGIEHPEQADLLVSRGCQYGQGYFFSPAVPVDGLAAVAARLAHLADASARRDPRSDTPARTLPSSR